MGSLKSQKFVDLIVSAPVAALRNDELPDHDSVESLMQQIASYDRFLE